MADNNGTKADKQAAKATQEITDAGAGAPPSMQEAAENLRESDKVLKAHKRSLLAETAQEEAQAKKTVVEESPDSPDTPSGAAIRKTAGISDNVERGEEYTRLKMAVRTGTVEDAEK